jgi:hypothetical protein
LAAPSGSGAAMIALTSATPSRDFLPAPLWKMMRCRLDPLMPPMHTVGMSNPASATFPSMSRTPAVPMMSLAFVLLGTTSK